MKILWCITGAGHLLKETLESMLEIKKGSEVTVVMSSAGQEVAAMYGLLGRIKKDFPEIVLEKEDGKSAPFIGRLWGKEYGKVIIAPCTANTAAKIASGVADSLVSNIAAQAGKREIPLFILPTDSEETTETCLPDGRKMLLTNRDLDLNNTKRLAGIQGITVIKDLEELI